MLESHLRICQKLEQQLLSQLQQLSGYGYIFTLLISLMLTLLNLQSLLSIALDKSNIKPEQGL